LKNVSKIQFFSLWTFISLLKDIPIPYFEVDVQIYDDNFVEAKTVKYMEIELSPEYDRTIATIQLKIMLMQERCIKML